MKALLHASPSSGDRSRLSLAAAELFERLRDEVADLVGTAATAALLRRALRRGTAKEPALAALVLQRDGLEYAWALPPAWHDPTRRDAVEHLRRLVREDLHPLFRELTGPVIARRLAEAPELVEAGLASGAGGTISGDGQTPLERASTGAAASVLADLAHAFEPGEDAEVRLRRALAGLGRLVPHDRCVLVNAVADDAPRLVLEPPPPEAERPLLEARAEALLASLLDRAPGALGPVGGREGSHLAVPLVALDEVAGVLLVERDGAAYGAQDLQLLSVVAAMLGAYVASLRLHGEERRVSQELRDGLARRTQFLAILSHELRNSLGPIGNALHVIERVAPGSEKALQMRAIIVRQLRDLARLVDDLLDATRLAGGKVQVRRARLDLAEVVRRAVEDHRSLFARAGVGLELRGADRPLWMDGDAVRLSQVFGNLLANAAKFASPGGRAEISVARDAPRTAVVRVRDDGVGIAPDVRARLFEPFARGADAPDRSRGGLGLGLALAKGLVDLHGGTIAACDVSRGAELVVSLPLLADEAEAQAAPAARQAPADRPAHRV